MKTTRPRKVQGVSFEGDILTRAKEKALRRRQSFSAYINQLISEDLTPNKTGSNSAKIDEGGKS